MNDRGSFSLMMDELAEELGTKLRFGGNGAEWIVPLFGGDVSVNVAFREKTGHVIVWALVDQLMDDERREERARALLAMTAFGSETHGFTLALDPETHDLVALGRLPVRRLDGLSALAHWIGDLGEVALGLRITLTEAET